MKCTTVRVGGVTAIVCGGKGIDRIRACGHCGEISTQLCDWKLDDRHTCDMPLCRACSTVPAPDKDLCRTHAIAWGAILAASRDRS